MREPPAGDVEVREGGNVRLGVQFAMCAKDVVKIACRFEKGFIGAVECLHDLATWITSHWKHQAAGNRAGPNSQQVYLAREALELQQRAGMIYSMSQDVSASLSKVE